MKTAGLLILVFLMTPSLGAGDPPNLNADRYDSNFAKGMQEDDAFRIAACRLAEQRASSPAVLGYASAKMKSPAGNTEQTDAPSVLGNSAISSRWQSHLDSLKACAGADFDRAFLTSMIIVDLSDRAFAVLEFRLGRNAEAKAAVAPVGSISDADVRAVLAIMRQLPKKSARPDGSD